MKEAMKAKMTKSNLEQMHEILDKQGVAKAGVFAHRLPEPSRTNCLKQLLLDCQVAYSVFEERWVQKVIDGRIKSAKTSR